MSCLCILKINPLLVASLTNIFFPIPQVVFSVYGFLCCAKAFKLIRYNLLIFVIIAITLGDGSKKKKNIATIYVKLLFCLCFPLGVLEYLVLTFWSSPFWVIFIYIIFFKMFWFQFFTCGYPVFPASVTEETVSFLHCIFFKLIFILVYSCFTMLC